MTPRRPQAPTEPTTTQAIMRSPAFARGLADIRAGRPFDADLATEDVSWDYERGRLFGAIASLSMRLFIGRKLNPKAVGLCEAAFNRKLII